MNEQLSQLEKSIHENHRTGFWQALAWVSGVVVGIWRAVQMWEGK